jgi:Na+/proline symporter/signal transduction histidine kinase
MQFELWQLFAVGVAYLGLLFVIATATERRWIPESVVRHPLVYTLSLGVYATSWSFYGSVGFAQREGYSFLTIYLGVTLAFVASPILLKPILKLTREYRLASLADLFAFRYHSQFAGVLVTLFMLAGILPYMALQIQAVTDSLQALSVESHPGVIALGFCLTIALFSVLFGARHISLREKHEGLVVAIAFESLVKLVVLMAVGLFAIFGVLDGFDGINQFLAQHPEAQKALFKPINEGPWATLLLLSFAAAFLLPRQFHMIFVENMDERSLGYASWAFPLFLLLLNLAIPPILWAGQSLQLDMPEDLYVLGITLHSGSTALPLLTFIGGISAASAMIIVTTLALASMCMNHLVLPASFPRRLSRLSATSNFYNWLLWGRRMVILLVIAAGYIFYLLLESRQGLAGLGLISFVAVAQFLPGIFGLLYWKRASRSGFIFGVLVGALIWSMTLLIPLFERAGIFELHIHDLFDAPISTTDSAIWSLLLNSLVFVVLSILRPQSSDEQEAAAACCHDGITFPKGVPQATSIMEFEEQLSKLIGADFAQHEVARALNDLGLQQSTAQSINLSLLRAQIGRNLSGLVGPVLSRMIVNEQLQIDTAAKTAIADTIQFVERKLEMSRSQLQGVAGELDALRRFHRQVLDDLPLGVVTISPEQQVVSWNRVMVKLSSLSEEAMVGERVVQLPEPWAGLLTAFLQSHEPLMSQLKMRIDGEPHILNLFKASIAGPSAGDENRGIVVLIEDYSELYKLEEKLVHSERLASIGKLASGVAHEIGNPVTGIACLAQEMLAEPENREIQRHAVEQILTQTERISNIVHSLVSFSHVGAAMDHPMEPVQIRQMLSESISFVSLSHAAKRQIYQNHCAAHIEVLGDHQKLQQVFVNLLTNASDASPLDAVISIECAIDGRYARISVSDSGSGIDEQLKARIFEPFVTTKQAGEGTGLGLSLAYNIVQEHGGTITMESERGKGTRVDVTLPLTQSINQDM